MCGFCLLHFQRQTHKIVRHTQTIRRLLSTNCMSVFEYFVELTLKGLMINKRIINGIVNKIISAQRLTYL